MYTPKFNNIEDIGEILAFIDRFSFGLLISKDSGRIIGTHIPILSNNDTKHLKLHTHIALANGQWKEIEDQEVLIVFTEPHAYISPIDYLKEESVPTWNYVAVHMYGKVSLVNESNQVLDIMKRTMIKYEPSYYEKWTQLSDEFKERMLKGIVTFEIDVTEIQGKAKLSQNKSEGERANIIKRLNDSPIHSDVLLAEYMNSYLR